MNSHEPIYSRSQDQRRDPSIQESTLRVGIFVAVAVFLASLMPAALVALTLSNLLFMAAIMSSIVAVFVRDVPFASHLTRWDEAAALMGIALIAGAFVDPASAQAAIEELQMLSATTATGTTQ